MTVRRVMLVASTLCAAIGVAHSFAEPVPTSTHLRDVGSFASIADRDARARALFGEMMRVIGSPRCLNCHPATRAPLQRDLRPHTPPVDFDTPSSALSCATCHHDHNTPTYAGGINSIPGAPGWALAPQSMAWVGKSPAEICRQLKDTDRNGGRDLAALRDHFAHDRLVGWAWHPGDGRTPVPGTQAQFGALSAAWIADGAACPDRG